MTTLFSFILRFILKLDKSKHPWVRRVAIIAAIVGWLSRKFGTRSQVVKLRRGETLHVSLESKKG